VEDDIECMDTTKTTPSRSTGMNLAHLMPFLVNVAQDASYHCVDLEELHFKEDILEMHSFSSDFPFFSPLPATKMDDSDCPESEDRLRDEMVECWRGIVQQLQVDENLRHEFRTVKERWKDVMKCLRHLNWKKVQSHLQQMEDGSYVYDSPALVFWSSGGRIHHANSTFCKMIGYNVEELRVQMHGEDTIGAHSLFHPDEIVTLLKRQLEASQHPHRSSYYMRTRLVTKLQQEIPVSVFVTNLRDSLGGSVLTVAHFANV
jgi:PAS domain S-box-containing protein